MEIEQWWSKLQQATRDWLIANNGDLVPVPVVDEIKQVGGPDLRDVSEVGQPGYFSDEVIDWIEAVGNDEAPGSP